MNERIKELANQAEKFYVQECTASASHFTFEGYVPKQFLEKFAELIVRECAEAVKNSIWHLPQGYKAVDQAEFVKKHFGVE